MKEQSEHNLLLKWLILTGLISFSVVAAWSEGIIFLSVGFIFPGRFPSGVSHIFSHDGSAGT